ncbi:MAG: hypothetical protein U5L96_19250 [Owenweeksia sp.]|nr:hypothetical protein [Owenweeksia sp.]
MSKTLFMLFLATTMSAQNHPHCGTDEYTDALLKEDPSVAQEYARAEAILSQKAASSKKSTAGVVYKVPVVIHVIL